MLENGADLRFIQQMLSHRHVTTTEIYTNVSVRMLKAIHAATHPSAKLEPTPDMPRPATAAPAEEPDLREELLSALAAEAAEEEDEDG